MPPLRPRSPVRRALATLGLGLGLGCQVGCGPELPAPVVEGVSPTWGYNGRPTTIEIRGRSFFPRLQVDEGPAGRFDHEFRVFLEDGDGVATELEGVDLADYRHIEAVVPAGLPVGPYDLRVRTPSGKEGGLESAFAVRDTLAAQLALTPQDDDASWTVGEYASVEIELLDVDGGRVTEDLDVWLRAEGANEGTLFFQEDGLLDQVADDNGAGIRGRLGNSGRALVSFTSLEAVDALVLRVDAEEEGSDVAGDLRVLSFQPSAVEGLRVELSEAQDAVVAGTSFRVDIAAVDAEGNVAEGVDTVLLLSESCANGTLYETVRFAGQLKSHPVRLTRATQEDCLSNAVRAEGFAGGVPVSATSPALRVDPGPAIGLALQVLPRTVVAGVDRAYVFVRAVDAWGNLAAAESSSLSLTVSTDGAPFTSPAVRECTPMVGGEAVCQAVLEQAGDSVLIGVSTVGPGVLSGISAPIVVLPGEIDSLHVTLDRASLEAGGVLGVEVEAQDELGNAVWLDPSGEHELELLSETADLSCVLAEESEARPQVGYLCLVTRAADDHRLEVRLLDPLLSAESESFEVYNAAVHRVEVRLADTLVAAGEPLHAWMEAFDAWGNPWRRRADPALRLEDLSGSLSPSAATFDADGRVELDLMMTLATVANELSVRDGAGTLLGRSEPFEVIAGEAVGLELELSSSLAWVGEPLAASVRAVDAWGNTADEEGTVEVSVLSGRAPAQVVELEAGEAPFSLSWTAGALDDRVSVEGELGVDQVLVDALDGTCADGPTADLLVGGAVDCVLCRLGTTGSTRSVTVSAAASTGSRDLVRFFFREDGGEWSSRSTASYTTAYTAEGRFVHEVAVADSQACGATATASAWVGDPDGEAVGPLALSLGSSELRAGDSGAAGSTTVSVTATDCAGDPAAGASLLVRADRGAVVVDGSTVRSTGKGLSVTLDSLGQASLSWSAASTTGGGTGRIGLGREDGAAIGQAALSFTNDATRPQVLELSPVGRFDETHTSIRVRFSEEILAASLLPTMVRVTDPDGAILTMTAGHLSLDGDELEISLSAPLDPGRGAWQLYLDSALRDLDGNRLDGAFAGVRAPFSRELGGVADLAPDLLSCSASTSTFRPDGDSGSGEEVEQVSVAVEAASAPAWWRWELTDAQGARRRLAWASGTGSASATLTWDGRDQGGAVLEAGTYRLAVQAADGAWNLGAGCELSLRLAQRLSVP